MSIYDEMLELIIGMAKADDRIRAVTLSGSRANKDCPADIYQDFDITYFVDDVSPFWDNEPWIEEHFGRPSLMQKPESIELIPPDRDGSYPYLMLFPDGNRIDLTFTASRQTDSTELYVILLDKDGMLPQPACSPAHWNVKKPTEKLFDDCCCEFHWCLNNAAKGIARDELAYTMHMLAHVRDMLILMLGWYAGTRHGFGISVGKHGKYLKKHLPADIYGRFAATYCRAVSGEMWQADFDMLSLFGDVARSTAAALGFTYNAEEEKGIAQYMQQVRDGQLR